MRTKLAGPVLFAAVGGIAMYWALATRAEEGVRVIPDTVVNSQPVSPSVVMHAKLSAAQGVLGALLSHDFPEMAKTAGVLSQLAEAVPSSESEVHRDQIYEHFRAEFVRQSVRLADMAKARNLEGAAYVNQNMTSVCIACHQHLRDGHADTGGRHLEP